MKQMLTIILISFLATAAAIKAAPALGQPMQPQNVTVVRTGDLDLSTSAGRKALDRRLVLAADEVCGPASDVDLAGRNAVRRCRANVLAKARSDARQIADAERSVLVAASR